MPRLRIDRPGSTWLAQNPLPIRRTTTRPKIKSWIKAVTSVRQSQAELALPALGRAARAGAFGRSSWARDAERRATLSPDALARHLGLVRRQRQEGEERRGRDQPDLRQRGRGALDDPAGDAVWSCLRRGSERQRIGLLFPAVRPAEAAARDGYGDLRHGAAAPVPRPRRVPRREARVSRAPHAMQKALCSGRPFGTWGRSRWFSAGASLEPCLDGAGSRRPDTISSACAAQNEGRRQLGVVSEDAVDRPGARM
jgi:hypothetical protein